MIRINGAFGEGGGQILRTSLGLSLVTGKAFTIENIRAGRKKPGILRQHLTAVNAAAEISGASVSGAQMGSGELVFRPGKVRTGNYRFAVGTAGSATLVLQTILPALLTGSGESEIVFEGGTHNPWAPPYDFLADAFFNVLGRMGARIRAELVSHGFYPAGGGCFRVNITAADTLEAIDLTERGGLVEAGARCLVSKLPIRIAEEEARIIAGKLGWNREQCRAVEVDSDGPGNIAMITVTSENITEVFTGFGKKGVSLRVVAATAAEQARNYLDRGLVVGEYLADQLLVPMVIAGGGRFVSGPPSLHTRTNIEVIKQFMDAGIFSREMDDEKYEIRVS